MQRRRRRGMTFAVQNVVVDSLKNFRKFFFYFGIDRLTEKGNELKKNSVDGATNYIIV